MPSFQYFRNLYWQYIFEKLEKADSSPSSLLTRYNTTHPEEQHLPLKQGPPPFFHPDTNPIIGHTLVVHFVDKPHVPVATVKLIWLLFLTILSFTFVPTPRKSLRFTRFRRSYVNHPAVVLTNHCQSYTVFFAWCVLFKVATFFFLQLLLPNCSAVAFLRTPVTRMLLTPRWAVVVKNISNLTVGVKHSIGLRTKFSPTVNLVEEESLEYLPILQHLYHDCPTLYLKHATWDSWNNIFFAYLSQESMALSLQLQLAYLYYLEPSLTVLQNCRITAFVNLWLTPLKYQKVEKQQQQNR